MRKTEPDFTFIVVPNGWVVYKVKNVALSLSSITESSGYPSIVLLDALVKEGLAEMVQTGQVVEIDNDPGVDIPDDVFRLEDDDDEPIY